MNQNVNNDSVPNLSTRLAGELLVWEQGKATLAGASASLEELAAEYGTPCYVYDRSILERQYKRLRHALPEPVEIYYSIKANPHPSIVNVFVEQGAGCEIASGGEYVLARRAGAAAERIVFAGPGKGRDEIEFVVSRGIGEIHLEGFDEVELLDEITRLLDVPVNVSIRINPSAASGGGLLMGGQPTAFGFEEESLDDAVRAVMGCSHMRLRGVHLYTGTQILSAEILLKHWQHAIELAKHTSALSGQPIATIDLGGGLGIPYFAHEKELDLDVLGEGTRALVAEAHASASLSHARFVVEPGRFLSGPAGIYVARVRSVKMCRGTTFVVLDGGMNHNLAASGNLGQVVRRDYPIVNLSRSRTDTEEQVVIVGPLCTPIDTLGRKVMLPRPQRGDLLGILQSGAYGLSASPVRFLSHATPAEILVGGASQQLITPRVSKFE